MDDSFEHRDHHKEPLPLGGSSDYIIDADGKVFLVSTPADPHLNNTYREVLNPPLELIAQLTQRQQEAREALQKMLFNPDNTQQSFEAAAERVWLEDMGVDPNSLL